MSKKLILTIPMHSTRRVINLAHFHISGDGTAADDESLVVTPKRVAPADLDPANFFSPIVGLAPAAAATTMEARATTATTAQKTAPTSAVFATAAAASPAPVTTVSGGTPVTPLYSTASAVGHTGGVSLSQSRDSIGGGGIVRSSPAPSPVVTVSPSVVGATRIASTPVIDTSSSPSPPSAVGNTGVTQNVNVDLSVIERELVTIRLQMHRQARDMHVAMLRQFQQQSQELSAQMAALMEENAALRHENAQLKRTFL